MTSSNGLGEHALVVPFTGWNGSQGCQYPTGCAASARRRRTARIAIGSILILGLITLYVHWKAGNNSATRPAVLPVMISTATANSGDIGVYVNALGTVTPLNTVSLTARVSGQISKVEYQEGQRVHIGDPLVEIDSRSFSRRQ